MTESTLISCIHPRPEGRGFLPIFSVKEVNKRVVAAGDTPFNLQPVLITLIVSVAILIVIIGVIFLRKKWGQKDK